MNKNKSGVGVYCREMVLITISPISFTVTYLTLKYILINSNRRLGYPIRELLRK